MGAAVVRLLCLLENIYKSCNVYIMTGICATPQNHHISGVAFNFGGVAKIPITTSWSYCIVKVQCHNMQPHPFAATFCLRNTAMNDRHTMLASQPASSAGETLLSTHGWHEALGCSIQGGYDSHSGSLHATKALESRKNTTTIIFSSTSQAGKCQVTKFVEERFGARQILQTVGANSELLHHTFHNASRGNLPIAWSPFWSHRPSSVGCLRFIC